MKTILVLAAALAAQSAHADGYKAIARELSSAASKAGVKRVAVMPFVPADGGVTRDGWNIAEKLVTQLVLAGKVQALERSLLSALMEEHKLGQTGALDPAGLRKLGRVLSAQAVVTGSFTTIGREVVVNARLVDVETGVIVAACERRAGRDWFDLAEAPASFAPAPELTAVPPALVAAPEADAFADLRDSVSSQNCEYAAARVDKLEETVLELKARYWALRLKKGLPLSQLKTNPGSTISAPALRERFYARTKELYESGRIPALTAAETKRFVAVDGEAYSLHQTCSL